jgi:hypothetical protein
VAEDNEVKPLPRRTPGATGSPRPPARVGPPVLPESLRQRVLSAIADAQERDAAADRAAAPQRDAAADRAAAPQRDAAADRAAAPQRGTAADRAAAPQRDAAADRAAAPQRGTAADRAAAPERGRAADRAAAKPPLVPPPRWTPDAGGRPRPSAWDEHDDRPARPPRLPAEALTEPIQRIPRPSGNGTVSPDAVKITAQPVAPQREARRAVDSRNGTAATAAVPMPAEEVARHRSRRSRQPSGRRYRAAGAIVATIACVTAASLTLALSGHAPHGGHRARAPAPPIGAVARNLAAAWVARQVSRTDVVSCDPVMCQALRSRGVPASDLDELGPKTASPLGSEVLVATAAVRAQFGSVLSSVYAPAVMASFGSGQARINIREIAPHGAAAYWSALHHDQASRKTSGAELLNNTRITASAVARDQLASGQVDPRLLNAIAVMAARQSIFLVAFRGFAPGAAALLPLRFVDVAEAGSAPQSIGRPATAGFVQSMVGFLRVQRAPFRPLVMRMVALGGGQVVLRVGFAAPSPLELLGP